MKKLAILAPAVVLIFACSGGNSLQAGQWELTTKITSVEVPGQPPAVAEQMKQMIASRPVVQNVCITAEQAANPGGRFANPSGQAQGCTFTKQTFAGGTIDIAGSCQNPGGGTINLTQQGTYTADTMTARVTVNVEGGPQQVRTSGEFSGRRTGDCPG